VSCCYAGIVFGTIAYFRRLVLRHQGAFLPLAQDGGRHGRAGWVGVVIVLSRLGHNGQVCCHALFGRRGVQRSPLYLGYEEMMDKEELVKRVHRELADSYDEEMELELEDRTVDPVTGDFPAPTASEEKEYRRLYFRELFRLQGELVKLQDWVVQTGHKVVIVFEGRDAAGKGGVIKRITQRLNPRVAAWRRCRRPTTANARNGISSAMCRTCRRPARSCCSTAAGTTAPAWSA
jgi:hypothetical protein